ncbi:MAG: class I SAM-dependent methyltransferase [Okeania sp. SIO2C9]|uniref:class I SAM-dependent DNA methyltransferase n=1 Tax=Okeania sp. SIO2C9 TaxID=2607791 RepID=UPI0013BFE8F2|nr:class I SAM-dependent methyltransferase [Okeania sp. SIO2C9]NEQ73906.1 class I SAM-dependent methyltransferase [Okeania sp. SIO2C9]
MTNKISTEEFYDNFALKYDDIAKARSNLKFHNEAVKIFHQYNHHQGTILDIGCGTGFISELLEGNFEYTGIDISAKMLDYAAKRGYKTIHKQIEKALPEIDSQSYDFVLSLSSLLFLEDAKTAMEHIYRIACQAILITLDEMTEEYIKSSIIQSYDHSKIVIENAIEDYFIVGWTSSNQGVDIRTRVAYIQQKN